MKYIICFLLSFNIYASKIDDDIKKQSISIVKNLSPSEVKELSKKYKVEKSYNLMTQKYNYIISKKESPNTLWLSLSILLFTYFLIRKTDTLERG